MARSDNRDERAAEVEGNGKDDSNQLSSGEENDPINATFENIITSLMSSSPPSIEQVVEDHKKELNRTTRDQETILHLIASSRRGRDAANKLEAFVCYLIKDHPDLIKMVDDNGKTPLRIAIKRRRATLIKAMCKAVSTSPSPKLDEILFIEDSSGNNCLHEAMLGTPSNANKIALDLIGRVQEREQLCRQNHDGCTPLHIAVEYARCTKVQLDVVRKLLGKSDVALDANVGSDTGKLSVYRYHQKTRLEKLENEGADHGNNNVVRDQRPPNSSRGLKASSVLQAPAQAPTPRGNTASAKKPEMNVSAEIPLQGIRRASTSQTAPAAATVHGEGQGSKGMGKSANMALPSAGPSAAATDADSGKNGKNNLGERKRTEEESVTKDSADKIKDLLKLRFMMNSQKDHDTTVSFLYGALQERELFFSLVDGPASLSKQVLEDSNHLQFEDTLRYVELPQFEIERPVPSKLAPKISISERQVRTDYAVVLEWLHRKGVKRILNLSVLDLKEPSHNDETIENALRNIEVIKLWDWQKSDLSSETIVNAAKNVEEVYLYWSGNNAVLRSWSEPEGLNRLENLRSVKVFWTQGLETRDRTRKNLSDFSDRLKRNRETMRSDRLLKPKEGNQTKLPPEITVDFSRGMLDQKTHVSGGSHGTSLAQCQEQHQWITCMEAFADFIQTAKIDDSRPNKFKSVSVALIDDGYDISEVGVNSKIAGGRSFCRHNSRNNHASYFVTTGGHGTAMANQICRVCPNAVLFMLRLDEFVGEQGKRQFTAKSAAQAVNAAIGMDVDIISMSWSIEETAQNKEHIEQLTAALEEAAKRNILLFCAAPDQGPNMKPTYPAASWRCIKVGGAEASGKVDKMVGASPVDFLFPGRNVLRKRPDDLDRGGDIPSLTGSSVSTALAAGLAALSLYCVKFAIEYAEVDNAQGPQITAENLRKLKTHNGMVEAFNTIGTTPESKHKYVAVWDVFQLAAGLSTSDPGKCRREAILKVARKLVGPDKLDVPSR